MAEYHGRNDPCKKADLGSKRLISLAPNNWVQWVTQQPGLEVLEFLDSEFQWIGRENDVLIKVVSPQQGSFLLLNEIQLRYSGKMPRRMSPRTRGQKHIARTCSGNLNAATRTELGCAMSAPGTI